MKRLFPLACAAPLALLSMPAQAQQAPGQAFAVEAQPAMPAKTTRTGKHINRIIDMWLNGQPVYYTQIPGGGYE